MKPHCLLLFACTALLIYSCDVPRNNPFDPRSSNYLGLEANPGSIQGRITTFSGSGLSGAFLYTYNPPGDSGTIYAANSDFNGFYNFSSVLPGNYLLICSRGGYLPDTVQIQVNPGSLTSQPFQLDALPTLQDFRVTSHYINLVSAPPYLTHYIQADISATDLDGFINTYNCRICLDDSSIDTTFSIPYFTNLSVASKSLILPDTLFPGFTINQTLEGKLFSCYIWDNWGGDDDSSGYIVHVITQTPTPGATQPIYTPPFSLTWQQYSSLFPITFNVRISPNANGEPLTWYSFGLPSDSLSVTVSSLPSNIYFWTVEVEDAYGNTARSSPETFQIL